MMENKENDMDIKQFLEDYWKYIAAASMVILSTILSTVIIVKKSGGKISVWDALKTVILEKIPSWIAIVEKEGSGQEKKNAVLNLAVREASEILGRSLTPEETELIMAFAGKQIELVLATPQKKEVAPIPEKPKSKYRI